MYLPLRYQNNVSMQTKKLEKEIQYLLKCIITHVTLLHKVYVSILNK